MKKLFSALILFLAFNYIVYGFRLEGIDFNQQMDGKEGGYRELQLINDTNEIQRYKITVLKGSKNDGSKFITVYPKVVTVEPQSKSPIKVFAKAPSNIKKGLYDFQLEFRPVGIPTLAKAKEGVITGVSNVNIAPVVEMYGYVGEVSFQDVLRFENIKFLKESNGKGMKIEGNISNDSYAVIEFGVLAYGKDDYLLGGRYVDTIGNIQNKKVSVVIEGIKSSKDVEKLVLYRSINGGIEILKTIPIVK